jgi:hypothetical protein
MVGALVCLSMVTFAPSQAFPVSATRSVRPVEWLRGEFLNRYLCERPTQDDVYRFLGQPDFQSSTNWMTVWTYRKFGIEIYWRAPILYYSPAERMGPIGMGVLNSIPSKWVRGIALLLPLMEYSPPARLVEVKWIGW